MVDEVELYTLTVFQSFPAEMLSGVMSTAPEMLSMLISAEDDRGGWMF